MGVVERLKIPNLPPPEEAGEILRAIQRLPCGHFLMTAAFEDRRDGTRVRSVAPCSDENLLICVSSRKGSAVEPLIRDSRAFAINLVGPEDRLLLRKFPEDEALRPPPDEMGDPFDSIACLTLRTGSPVIERAALALDCEVVRHFDLEADAEIFVGQVVAFRMDG